MNDFCAKACAMFAVVTLLCVAAPAAAGNIGLQCDATECALTFEGEIIPGDAARVAEAIRTAPQVVDVLDLNSPGGDPFESLAIADVLNKNFVLVWAPNCDRSGCIGMPGHALPVGSFCASACALVFLAADDRMGTEVYLHRPTFAPALFARLSGPRAQQAYDRRVDRLLAALRQRRVPEAELQAMMNTPSEDLQKLPVGYPDESDWLTEWLEAKCGPLTISELDGPTPFTRAICRADAIEDEARHAQGKGPRSPR